MPELKSLEEEIAASIGAASDIAALEAVRVATLGKSGSITALLKSLGAMDPDERRRAGPAINGLKERVQALLKERREALEAAALEIELASGALDLSLPGPPRPRGSVHPILQTMDEVIAIFAEWGFRVAEGPDIEDDFHNFTALNFPPRHPAREIHDTFFLTPGADGERKLLRTHTSPIQVRVMRSENAPNLGPFAVHQAPPIRVIGPGRVYRRDSDATHTPMFHQAEGLVVDRDIHMGQLKWVLDAFIRRFFETDAVVTRFRPHYFPFTEPSAEMDVQCDRSGDQIRIGEGADWLEILGGGMVHPSVLATSGLDPDVWQGFAFGLGIDRLAALKYGMPDLRDMFGGDVRWLAHYGFSAFASPNPALGLS
ncbi:MAG TPA: phenylalanine--tRNA ligase subunit alpha [Caulobacteraceae bacterium]|nr:phenylalanine--tRNA ligase subunit alpha [Caulobacteraceae bacterium]